MNKLSNRSTERIKDLNPSLIEIIKEGITNSPFDFGIPKDGGRRTKERQKEIYAIGRTVDVHKPKVTWTLNSRHIEQSDGYGYAFDIYAYVNGKASWSMKYLEPIARHLQGVAKSKGIDLEWGQDLWGKDGAHFQIKIE